MSLNVVLHRTSRYLGTFSIIAACLAVHYKPELTSYVLSLVPFRKYVLNENTVKKICISPSFIIKEKQYYRLILSALFHHNTRHLLYTMLSLAYKGVYIEPFLSTPLFLLVSVFLIVISNIIYTITAAVLYEYYSFSDPMFTCSVGISTLLFSYNVFFSLGVGGMRRCCSFRGVIGYLRWFELWLMTIIAPETSLIGHVCGIVSGIVYFFVIHPLFTMAYYYCFPAKNEDREEGERIEPLGRYSMRYRIWQLREMGVNFNDHQMLEAILQANGDIYFAKNLLESGKLKVEAEDEAKATEMRGGSGTGLRRRN